MKRADRQPLSPPPWHRPHRRQAGATTRSCIGNRQLRSRPLFCLALFFLSSHHTHEIISNSFLSHISFFSLCPSPIVSLGQSRESFQLVGHLCVAKLSLSDYHITHIARLGVRHESLLLLLSTVQLSQSSVCPLSNRAIPLIGTQAHHIYRFLCLSVIVHLSESSSHSKRETPRRISYHSLKSCRI